MFRIPRHHTGARTIVIREIPRHIRRVRLSPPLFFVLILCSLICIGTVLLHLPISQQTGIRVNILHCLFTATSATCVIGLVTMSTADTWSQFGQIVILLLIQIGGLGYMTLATVIALLLGVRLGVRARLHLRVAHGIMSIHDALTISKYVVYSALVFETVGATLLARHFFVNHGLPLGRAVYEGIFYAVSGFCNAGFDLVPGFAGFTTPDFRTDIPLLLIVGVLIILGGLGFGVLAELTQRPRLRTLSLYSKLVLSTTLALLLLGMGMFYLFEHRNVETIGLLSTKQQLVTSWFMSVTPRSAGFSPIDMNKVNPPTALYTTIFMIIGASPNSMAGGIKTTTMAVILLAAVALMRRRPDVEIFRRRISGETVRLALSLVIIYMLAILLILVGVSIQEVVFHPTLRGEAAMMHFLRMTFEFISAFGTVGLTTGIIPTLKPLTHFFLIVGMVLGRMGPLMFVFYFAQTKHAQLRRLPSEPIMTG